MSWPMHQLLQVELSTQHRMFQQARHAANAQEFAIEPQQCGTFTLGMLDDPSSTRLCRLCPLVPLSLAHPGPKPPVAAKLYCQ